jgi:ABC-type bacteriocin/lantibiotic exporter with double-glycine peptidase domain
MNRTSPFGYLWWLLVCQWRRGLLGSILGVSWMVGLTVPPFLLSLAIDRGLASGRVRPLLGWAAAVLVVGVLNAWLAIMRHRTMTKLRVDGYQRSVSVIVDHCIRLGPDLRSRVRAGEVVTIGIGDVSAMVNSLTIAGPGVGAAVAYAVIAVLLWSVNPLLAVVVLVGVPLLAVVLGPLFGRLQRAGTTYRRRQAGLTAQVVDIVAGLGVLAGFGGKDVLVDRYRRESRALVGEGYSVGTTTSWIQGLAVGLPALFLAVVTWLAARMAADGHITIGQLVAVYGYAGVLVVPVSFFIESGVDLSRALVAARRLVTFLAVKPEADSGQVSTTPKPGAPLTDPASGVEVAGAKLTAVATADHAAALQVVDRLGRLTTTDVVWDGTRLTDLPLREVRDRILVADNEADIFTGRLRDVVRGRFDRSTSDIVTALHTAAADDVVLGLHDGLDARIERQGRNLSGGQRQRIRLARAVLADPEVLLAVEPTSAVDVHTEAAMAERLRAARAGRTTLVVTTSAGLLDQADTVLYLEQGRVAAYGSHRDLLRREPGYRRLVSPVEDTPSDEAAP